MLAKEFLSGLETQKGWGWFLIQSRSLQEHGGGRKHQRHGKEALYN